MKAFAIVFLIMLLWLSGEAQTTDLRIKKSSSKIIIDAKMDEPAWVEANVAKDFKQNFPFDSSYAKAQTEVRITYDEHFVYVFAIMYNLGPRKYVTPSLRRDFSGAANDGFSIVLDTYQDKTNAFVFGINPFGVQREGLISNGGANSEDLSLNWDNKWFSEARIENDRWICEFAIPFKTIRYKEGSKQWNINFFRVDSKYTERSVWVPVPRVYTPFNLAFVKEVTWDEPLKHPGGNISLIPYVAPQSFHNFEKAEPVKNQFDFGGDAKVALGPALNLDLTINPDFSQVEVDQQVTNLNRFEIFYPEKRQFFLENADLFGNFGYSNSRPFFSRRIGVTRDPSTGQNIQNKIYGGVRLSGKIDNNWRIGLLSMQGAEDKAISLPSTNYTVGAIQRKLFARSNIGMIAINKQAFQDSIGGNYNVSPQKFNRLLGWDYNLASKDTRWTGKLFYHRSFSEQHLSKAYSTTASFAYQTPKVEYDMLIQDVGVNFNPEVGYAPRKNFRRVAPEFYYSFYPKSKIINSHGPGTDIDVIGNSQYGLTDWDANLWYKIKFQNTASFFTRIRRDYVYLFSDFDPSGSGGLVLPQGSDYHWNSLILSYQSNARKKLYYNFQTRLGQYFNGNRYNIDGSVSYRVQPFAILSMDISYNRILLPQPYSSADLLVLSPKFDFTFSRKLFWTTYFQYNNQIKNLNINSRLQWRFRPVSDLFLVYTDNYFAEAFKNGEAFYLGQPKLRAIVLKFTYWLNL